MSAGLNFWHHVSVPHSLDLSRTYRANWCMEKFDPNVAKIQRHERCGSYSPVCRTASKICSMSLGYWVLCIVSRRWCEWGVSKMFLHLLDTASQFLKRSVCHRSWVMPLQLRYVQFVFGTLCNLSQTSAIVKHVYQVWKNSEYHAAMKAAWLFLVNWSCDPIGPRRDSDMRSMMALYICDLSVYRIDWCDVATDNHRRCSGGLRL